MGRENGRVLLKGHPEEELIRIVHDQIASVRPMQIRVLEGMGYAVYTREQIKKIKRKTPEERAVEIQEIISDMRSAYAIFVENPHPPKPRDY